MYHICEKDYISSNNYSKIFEKYPFPLDTFQKYAIEKYGSEDKLQEVHHYVTQDMFDDNKRVVIPEGLVVDSNFDSRYLERNKARQEEVTFAGGTNLNPIDSIDNAGTVKDSSGNIVIHKNILPVTNYEFEELENDAKRRIKIIKDDFLDVIVSDMTRVMKYKKSSQFITRREKWAYNPRLSGQ